MPFTGTADRTSLFVTGWSSGPPVVFTHSWGLQPDQWTDQIPRSPAPGRDACCRTGAATAGPATRWTR